MKRKVILSMVATGIVLSMVSMLAFAGPNGNGAPSGQHLNVNIIGVPKEKNENFDGGKGARIFVSRAGTTQFYVHGGNSFAILDHDGTDGKVGTGLTDPGIIFPYDAAVTNQTWRVQIWVRLLGPKGSEVSWTSYYYDTAGGVYVLWDSFSLTKSSKFTEKTGELLANGYQDMLWELEPVTKFRICQMRIYLLDE
jgi:hypothetical protein